MGPFLSFSGGWILFMELYIHMMPRVYWLGQLDAKYVKRL